MTLHTKIATIHSESDLHMALKIIAFETSRYIKDLVNQAVRESLFEEAENSLAYKESKDEKITSYDQMLKKLRKNGRI